MNKPIGLLRLYRADAATITFFSFLFGIHLSGSKFKPELIIAALLVSLISVNFIYSINSWFDRDIDAINKPHRVLPKRGLPPRLAQGYIGALCALAIIYPLLLKVRFSTVILLWIFPLLGILYSNPWFPFKKKSLLSVTTTAIILVLPMFVAIEICNALNIENARITGLMLLYCLCTIPLKDIEDIKGDALFKSQNWAGVAGTYSLVKICMMAQAVLAVIAFFVVIKPLNIFLSGMCLVSFLVIMTFLLFKLDITRLYRTIIRTIIICGVIFFFLTLVFI